MNIKKMFFLFYLLWFGTNLKAQNIIPNPSFEEFEVCPEYYTPKDGSHIFLPGWTYPTKATPDYFNRCSTKGTVGVPKNFAGISEPFEGKGYAGLLATGDKSGVNYREYIQAQLTSPMTKGEKYCVSFYYKLATYSKYSVDRLGLYFSDENITEDPTKNMGEATLPFTPQVQSDAGVMLNNRSEWKKICRVYTATGNERFALIGNFYVAKDTKIQIDSTAIPNKLGKEYAYYFIDEVSAFPIRGNCEACTCIPHDLKAEIMTEQRSMKIAASGGTPPYTYEWSNGATTPELIKASKGKYTYTVTDANGCATNGQVSFVPGEISLKVTHKEGFTGGNDGWIDLTVTGGKKPYKYKWSNGEITEDLQKLPEGTYEFLVTDANGDEVPGTIVFKDKFKEELEKVEEGGKITLKNIFFDFDKDELLPQSFVELDKLYDFMQANDIQKVEISGHTDSKGSDEYNRKLSDKRAKAVVKYLVDKGLDKKRLIGIGYGESQPVDTNETDEGRANNRRVEFKILKKK